MLKNSIRFVLIGGILMLIFPPVGLAFLCTGVIIFAVWILASEHANLFPLVEVGESRR